MHERDRGVALAEVRGGSKRVGRVGDEQRSAARARSGPREAHEDAKVAHRAHDADDELPDRELGALARELGEGRQRRGLGGAGARRGGRAHERGLARDVREAGARVDLEDEQALELGADREPAREVLAVRRAVVAELARGERRRRARGEQLEREVAGVLDARSRRRARPPPSRTSPPAPSAAPSAAASARGASPPMVAPATSNESTSRGGERSASHLTMTHLTTWPISYAAASSRALRSGGSPAGASGPPPRWSLASALAGTSPCTLA